MWADAAQALQTMDDFVAQHPQLASLLSNAGAMAGGAMWLKNLTPSGIASYLLANYGYNKIIELAGGSLEKGKAYLAQFFVKHDEDITQEQATYLANFTMNLLTDVGGRILFHQVAAQGFQKVRQGGQWINRRGPISVLKGKTAAEALPNLSGKSPQEARQFLLDTGYKTNGKRSAKGWETFKHPDGSKVDIGEGGRVVRTQAPKYGQDGLRINKGQRVDGNGNEIPKHIEHADHPKETLSEW